MMASAALAAANASSVKGLLWASMEHCQWIRESARAMQVHVRDVVTYTAKQVVLKVELYVRVLFYDFENL